MISNCCKAFVWDTGIGYLCDKCRNECKPIEVRKQWPTDEDILEQGKRYATHEGKTVEMVLVGWEACARWLRERMK